MSVRNQPYPRVSRWLQLAGVGLVVLLLGTGAAHDNSAAADNRAPSGAVTAWARRHAQPLTTVDPTAPSADLSPVATAIGDAAVVGLGESVHGAAEEIGLKHRVLGLLVEQLGFRSIAWEEDWTTGVEINNYILGGAGDPDELVARMSPQYQFRQVADVLRWLRDFNGGRRDPVQFVGVEYYFTRQIAYDTVDTYVAAAAPERLDDLRAGLQPLEPTSPNPFVHIDYYTGVEDKQPFIDAAHAVHQLVASVPHAPGDRAHETALHASRQIVRFYEHYSLPLADQVVYREAQAADSLRWWQQLTGDRVVYWAATPHTANAPDLRIVQQAAPDMRFASAGSYLRRWYAHRYLSIGFTLDRGTVTTAPGETVDLPPARPEWFEHPLGDVRYDQFALDLRQSAPTPVRRWLHGPIRTRGLPDAGPGSFIDGGSVAQWFDLIIHRQTVTPA